MTIKQIKLALIAASLIAVAAITSTTVVSAATCGGVNTSIISCPQGSGSSGDIKSTGVWGVLDIAINVLAAGVAIAAVGGLVYGAVMYTTAGGSQEQVKKARTILTNVVIGIIAFASMYALLQWLTPGGVF